MKTTRVVKDGVHQGRESCGHWTSVEPVPLHTDAHRVLRVGGTRVPLETVVSAFDAGATPEEIAQDFPVLKLDDIYSVLTYYLRHSQEVAEYLRQRQDLAQEVRHKWEPAVLRQACVNASWPVETHERSRVALPGR